MFYVGPQSSYMISCWIAYREALTISTVFFLYFFMKLSGPSLVSNLLVLFFLSLSAYCIYSMLSSLTYLLFDSLLRLKQVIERHNWKRLMVKMKSRHFTFNSFSFSPKNTYSRNTSFFENLQDPSFSHLLLELFIQNLFCDLFWCKALQSKLCWLLNSFMWNKEWN